MSVRQPSAGLESPGLRADGVARPVCEYRWLGRVDYREAWEFQREIAVKRALGEVPDTLLLLEHPPVFTTGRRGAGENLRLPEELLGAPLIETDRGGDITFHGPGQLVAYPIVDLRQAGLTVVSYVRALEETIVRTLARYGIKGERVVGMTGVWVGDEKIAAIGVRVGRPAGVAGGWVTGHGLALNVDVDLDWFGRIVPCGIADRGVTSLLELTGDPRGVEAAAECLAVEFGSVFGAADGTGGVTGVQARLKSGLRGSSANPRGISRPRRPLPSRWRRRRFL